MSKAEYCDEAGANKLKATIEAYWRERGKSVTVILERVGYDAGMRSCRFDVRSTMVNGLPRG